MDVRLKNHKEDTHLQWKLEQIHRKYRLSLKLLYQERELILMEHKKLLHLRVCEPYATVNNAMRAISETRDDLQHIRHSRSAPAGRWTHQTEVLSNERDWLLGMRSSKSAASSTLKQGPALLLLPVVTRKASQTGPLSIMQLKEIALIDSISQKELASQKEQERQRKERLKQIQREQFQQKMQAFLRTLKTI